MTTPIKALFATLATGAMAVAVASPAMADDGFGHGRGGWELNNRGYGGRDNDRWNRGGNPRFAINACSRIVERSASRSGYGRAQVTDIRDVRDTRYGYEVRGRVDVSSGWRGGNRDGYGGSYTAWNDHGRGRDSGSFSCRFERGRVVALDVDGIRGL